MFQVFFENSKILPSAAMNSSAFPFIAVRFNEWIAGAMNFSSNPRLKSWAIIIPKPVETGSPPLPAPHLTNTTRFVIVCSPIFALTKYIPLLISFFGVQMNSWFVGATLVVALLLSRRETCPYYPCSALFHKHNPLRRAFPVLRCRFHQIDAASYFLVRRPDHLLSRIKSGHLPPY